MKRLGHLYRRVRYSVRRLVRLFKMLLDLLLTKPLGELRSPLLCFLLQIFRIIFFTIKDMGVNRTNIRTASLSFYTLMSLVPLLAVVFGAAKSMGYIEVLLSHLYDLFPQSPEIVDYCVDFAERTLARTRGGLMAAVAGVTMTWSAVSLMDELVKAFNDSWKVTERRNVGRYGAYLVILIFFPAFWISAEGLRFYLGDLFGVSEHLLYRISGDLVSTAIELGVFVLIYKVVPHAHVRWSSAAVAGLTAGVVFQLFQWLFGTGLLWVTSYSAIYGSFVALPLFLLWLRSSWQILLTGNELSYAFQHRTQLQNQWLVSIEERVKFLQLLIKR